MALTPLSVRITGDTTAFNSAMNNARRGLANFARAGAVAIGAVSGALTVMTARSLSTIDAQAKLARGVGGTTAAMQALDRAGDRAGVSTSELAGATTRLNQRLGEVIATGTGADDTFEALGITAQQLANMDIDERFAALSDAMQAAGMSSQEMSFHLRELGIRQASVVTLLQGGGDEIRRSRRMVEEFGVAVSEVEAAQIEKTNDAIEEMGRVFEGLANQLAVRVAPHLERFATAFTDLAREGGPVREALDRVVDSAGRLMGVLAQESTVTAFSSAIATTTDIVTFFSNAVVTVSQNIDILTIAATAAAVALALMGGPLTIIVRLAAVAAGGMFLLARNSRSSATAADAATIAQNELNAALGRGEFADVAEEALTLAIAYEEEARFALQAAEATYELAAARQAAITSFGPDSTASNPTAGGIGQEFRDAAEEVRRWQTELNSASRTVSALRSQILGNGDTPPGVPPGDTPGDPPEITPTGLGGGGSIADEFAVRLESLLEGMQTEREVLEAWYAEGTLTLEEALAQRLITEQEYLEARSRLEEEYARQSNQIEEMRNDRNIDVVTDGLNSILTAASSGNEKIMRVQRAFSAGMAWIDTLTGAAKMLRNGTFGFAQAAAVIAKGSAFVAAINSTSSGSKGAASGASGGSSSPAASAPAELPTQTLRFDFGGGNSMGMEAIVNLINEAYDQGYRIRGVVA
jgi:hypothetical protein